MAAAAFILTVFWLPPILQAGGATGPVLAALTGAALVLRERAPAGAALVTAATTIAGTVLGVCRDPMLATAWCLFFLARRAGRPRSPVLPLVLLIAGLTLVAAVPDREPGRQTLLAVVALTVAWLLGTAIERRIEEERARVQLLVARDVHDVVGHTLGVIGAEAGVHRALPDADADELRAALGDIETRARDALGEMRTLVHTLRSPAGPFDALVAATRAAGVRVTAQVSLPPARDGVALVAHRIAQEALSNVVRHAPGAHVSLRVRAARGDLLVLVRDDGPGTTGATDGPGTSNGPGFGLRGMRERAELVGGTARWGNRPGGGFEVRACLPLR